MFGFNIGYGKKRLALTSVVVDMRELLLLATVRPLVRRRPTTH